MISYCLVRLVSYVAARPVESVAIVSRHPDYGTSDHTLGRFICAVLKTGRGGEGERGGGEIEGKRERINN